MKKLELNQMENLNASFSWSGCAMGATGLAYSYGTSGAAIVGGFWGLGAAAAVGCVLGGMHG